MIGLDNEQRGEANVVEGDDCVHVTPNSVDLPDLALEFSGTWLTDFAWFTPAKPQEGCALCEIGCCVQRVSGNISMPAGASVVVHGVLGST